jgi:hypothetical protein
MHSANLLKIQDLTLISSRLTECSGLPLATIGADDDTFRNGGCRECEYVCLHSTHRGLSWA